MVNDLLYVYGTLLQKDNEFALYLQKNASFLGTGKFNGKLYDIGDYPGAIADKACEYEVHGSIFRLNEPEKLLKIIDDYEGYGPKQPTPNLFTRKLIKIETNNGIVKCWTYLYNRPVEGYHLISSGNYLKYKKA
jgi:gamma-glutamylcyclotransferase (GGCT)/AIG2-like uncharacterized protein YtfP